MMRSNPALTAARCAMLACALVLPAPLPAREGAHQHGVVRLDVTLDARTLTLQIEAPLDSLLGFEHRPRTAAQRQAADGVLKRINDGASLIRPDADAQCTLAKTTVESEVLQAAKPPGAKDEEHADLDATFQFTCQQPDKLAAIELGLFEAFKRIQRIEVRTAGAKGQSKQTLKRPDKLLRLRR